MSSPKEFDTRSKGNQSSFEQLKAAAKTLNAASDRLTKVVGEIEAFLKSLNIGLSSWVTIEETKWSDDQGNGGFNQVGYTKIVGKWCIALNEVSDFDEDPTVWVFNDAPRDLRLKSIGYFPLLLDKLAKAAEKMSHDVEMKTEQVETLMALLKGGDAR